MIIDFDGTLVLENSSWELERVVLEYLNGPRRAIVELVFFRASRFTNKLFGLISIAFCRRRDFRLMFFCWLLSGTLAEHRECIIDKTCSRLNLNRELFESLRLDEAIILSCGLDEVIIRFLDKKNLRVAGVKSSRLESSAGAVRADLISFHEKLKFLVEAGKFTYLTDDLGEARFIEKHCGKAEGRALRFDGLPIFEVRNLER